MSAARYQNTSTTTNCTNLAEMIKSNATQRIVLFASATSKTPDYSHLHDGADTNLPLMAAIAEVHLPGVETHYVVYDGLFLTAARVPRYHEVKVVLDVAESSGKAHFSSDRIRFTGSLSAEDASQAMLAHANIAPLTAASRPSYFSLLSTMSEKAIQAL